MKKNSKFYFSSKQKGKWTEKIACGYLRLKGYTIIDRNFETNFGELDIIAKKRGIVIVVEVKSRFQKQSWHPLTAIGARKKKKINQLVQYYIQRNNLFDYNIRIDAITLERNFFWFTIKHYKNIF